MLLPHTLRLCQVCYYAESGGQREAEGIARAEVSLGRLCIEFKLTHYWESVIGAMVDGRWSF
jgi:hypothetical protein